MKKVGIIGCGGIAQVHGWVLQGMENTELVAVCDVEEENAKALSEQYGEEKAKVYTEWCELCESDVDVVHICTPHYLHAPMAVELLRQGKASGGKHRGPSHGNAGEKYFLMIAESAYGIFYPGLAILPFHDSECNRFSFTLSLRALINQQHIHVKFFRIRENTVSVPDTAAPIPMKKNNYRCIVKQ